MPKFIQIEDRIFNVDCIISIELSYSSIHVLLKTEGNEPKNDVISIISKRMRNKTFKKIIKDLNILNH